MLCQPNDFRHYSDYVSLSNLMQAGAALFWNNKAVGLHVLVDFLYYTLNANSDSLDGFEIHRTKFLSNVRVISFYEFLYKLLNSSMSVFYRVSEDILKNYTLDAC